MLPAHSIMLMFFLHVQMYLLLVYVHLYRMLSVCVHADACHRETERTGCWFRIVGLYGLCGLCVWIPEFDYEWLFTRNTCVDTLLCMVKRKGSRVTVLAWTWTNMQVMLLGENLSYKNLDGLLAAKICICLAAALRRLPFGNHAYHLHLDSKLLIIAWMIM